MNRIFMCDSPYQLFSAMCIIDNEQTKKEDIIVLLCIFNGWEEYKNKLIQRNYKYIIVENFNRKLWTIINFIKICIGLRKHIDRFTRIFITSQNGYAVLFCHILNRYQNEICFFDEGLYTYICRLGENPFHEYYNNHMFFRVFLGWRKLYYNRQMYVFEPNLLAEDYKTNKIYYNKSIGEYLLFNNPNPLLIKSSFIIFDQYFLNDEKITKYENILNKLKNNIKKQICLKKHPRKDFIKTNLDYFNVVENDNNLWEIESIEINISGKILITSYSSAVFLPGILGAQNYTIILLYKLIMNDKESPLSRDISHFIKRFRMNITNVRIIIPESLSELIREVELLNEYKC